MSFTRVCLLQIEIPGVTDPLRYQSYQLADYAYDGYSWIYAPFEIRSQPQQSLELIPENGQIWIANNNVIRTMVGTYDGLRKSVVKILFLDPAGIAPTGMLLMQVISSSPVGGYFVFNLGTPTDALTGSAITQFFGVPVFPELPVTPARL